VREVAPHWATVRGGGVLAGAGFKEKLRAGEGGDALAPGLNELIEAIAFSGGGEDAGLEAVSAGRRREQARWDAGWGGLRATSAKACAASKSNGAAMGTRWLERSRASFGRGSRDFPPRRSQADAIAVMPGIGGEDVDFAGNWNSGAVEGFTKNGLLEGELGLVTGVLILAAATGSEVPAAGAMRWGAI